MLCERKNLRHRFRKPRNLPCKNGIGELLVRAFLRLVYVLADDIEYLGPILLRVPREVADLLRAVTDPLRHQQFLRRLTVGHDADLDVMGALANSRHAGRRAAERAE